MYPAALKAPIHLSSLFHHSHVALCFAASDVIGGGVVIDRWIERGRLFGCLRRERCGCQDCRNHCLCQVSVLPGWHEKLHFVLMFRTRRKRPVHCIHWEWVVGLYTKWDQRWSPGRHGIKLYTWQMRLQNLKSERRRKCATKY